MARWTDLATWRGPTVNQGGPMSEQRGVVVHIAEGTFEGTIAWQRNASADVSSHFVVARDGRIAQMVDTDVAAWTQRAGNGHWLSIENEGHTPNPLTAAQVEANAKILARWHQVYGGPLQLATSPSGRGLGHHSMGAESGVNWGHSDCPGPAIKAQKPAILARAIEITNGEDDDVTPADIEAVAARTKQLILTDGGMQLLFSRMEALLSGRLQYGTPAAPNVLYQKVLATNERVEGIYHDKDSVTQVWSNVDPTAADVNELKKAIGDVDEQTVAKLVDPATPDEQVADALRQLLADRPGVLALLAQS